MLALTLALGATTLAVGVAQAPAIGPSFRDEVMADNPAGYWRLGEGKDHCFRRNRQWEPGTYLQAVTLGVPGALATELNSAARFDVEVVAGSA